MVVSSPSVALGRLAMRTDASSETWSDLAEERDRIARDLHDVVVQRLFIVGLKLADSARRRSDDDELKAIVDDIDRSIADLRAVIFGLQRPQAIIGVDPVGTDSEPDGANSAEVMTPRSGIGRHLIARILADLADLIGHRPQLDVSGDLDSVCDDLLTEAGVVVRELLINALKHAHSSQTWVSVEVSDGMITIVVEDDGDGIRTLHPAQGGTGLWSLTRRARRIGGDLLVQHRTPCGTRMSWSVPMAEQRR